MQSTDKLLKTLQDFKQKHAQEYGLLEIGLFGSVARGELKESSDVDVVIRIERPDLFLLAGLKSELEEVLQCPVDIVTYRENMNPFLKRRIDKEALYA
ncbi:DNA polymerase beta domain protein region [Desulfurispirillum indicum S5]|uniref:DNA polymerase beta domain protein region n=1 Tax=Desulfurispirillum indicum (strain ATCC BAA-1389 / DSM 22839 / S5) TaxID=653733 RepID=E6W6J8_DESIS|nr:nucleotidyltransferase domain-containing protein [Desulfurispirillum indicum]ADU64998.1 DNA polymerase beta domain protein region [Desulfurispirillum indicum S5]